MYISLSMSRFVCLSVCLTQIRIFHKMRKEMSYESAITFVCVHKVSINMFSEILKLRDRPGLKLRDVSRKLEIHKPNSQPSSILYDLVCQARRVRTLIFPID